MVTYIPQIFNDFQQALLSIEAFILDMIDTILENPNVD